MTRDECEALPWTAVESSNLERIAWTLLVEEPQNMAEAEYGRLYIEFCHGGLYAYEKVPKDAYEQLRDDESPGSYLNEGIKPYHHCERIHLEG